MKLRNTLAFNPYMKKSHVHTERLENVKQIIEDDIDDWDYVNNLKIVKRLKTPAKQGFLLYGIKILFIKKPLYEGLLFIQYLLILV